MSVGHQRLRLGGGAILATLLAIHLGFNAVVLTGIVLYGLVLKIFPKAAATG